MTGQLQVMVVDDDLAMREYLCTFVTRLGYQPTPVGEAEEAITRFQAERPAAVLLDLVLPGGMDGLQALETFKKIDRAVPVIVLSGQERASTVVRAMKLGAFDFVSKPFDETGLGAVIANALERRRFDSTVATLRDNVRELENLIERAVVLGDEAPTRHEVSRDIATAAERLVADALAPDPFLPSLEPADTPAPSSASENNPYSLKDVSRVAARRVESELILKVLQHTRWNRKETAAILGISYKALLYKIKENGLDKAS